MVKVIPLFTKPDFSFNWETLLCLIRLVIFLLMITRFYLGAAIVFSLRIEKGEELRSGIDLFVGLAHFLMFVAWATTLTLNGNLWWHTSPFLVFLGGILLYDVVWWLFSKFSRGRNPMLPKWTVLNAATLAISCGIYWVLVWCGIDRMAAEEWCFLPAVICSLYDITKLLTGSPASADPVRDVIAPASQ